MEELCYGIIPLKREGDQWKVLLLHHRSGSYWAFPKGHAEEGESPQLCAERELLEETNLRVKEILFSEELFWESYSFERAGVSISKRVGYFAALVEGEISLQKKEILAADWFSIEEALDVITFPEAKSLLAKTRARKSE